MTPEQQRCEIAKACGWTFHGPSDMKHIAWACWVRPNGESWQIEQPPDYLNDLNAMHVAEKTLSHSQLLNMKGQLSTRDIEPMTATASQKAEAFLRTLGFKFG